MNKIIVAFALIFAAQAANAVTVFLVKHDFAGFTAPYPLITDGWQFEGQPATTAAFDWDGTTLTSVGLYSTVYLFPGGSGFPVTIFNDQVTDLTIDTSTSTASATSYFCNEGSFLASVNASGCGAYTFGSNYIDESTTTWSGTSVSQTLGGDDVSLAPPRDISVFNFGLESWDGTTLEIGNGLPLIAGSGGQRITFSTIGVVPLPAAAWLFGSALGLLGWARRKAT